MCEKLDLFCRVYPGARCLLARRTRTELGASTLGTLRDETIGTELWERWWMRSAEGGGTLTYPNGSIIVAAGVDDAQRWASSAWSLIAVDECQEISLDQWVRMSGRCRQQLRGLARGPLPPGWPRQPFRQVLGACNPEDPGHWIFQRFKPAQGSRAWEEGGVSFECAVFGEADNWENLPPDYVAWLKSLVGTYASRYRLGQWVAFEGSVFGDTFGPWNMVERPAAWAAQGGYPPADWSRHRAVDFGYRNPFVCLTFARDGDGRLWLYQQRYMTQRLVEDHARDLVADEARELHALREAARRAGAPEPRWLPWGTSVADHDSEGAETLRRHGVPTSPALKDREQGLMALQAALRRPALPAVIGALAEAQEQTTGERLEVALPGLVIVRGSLLERDPRLRADRRQPPTCLEEELPRLTWREVKEGKPEREEPRDIGDHAIDAARYLVYTLRKRGMVTARVLEVEPAGGA